MTSKNIISSIKSVFTGMTAQEILSFQPMTDISSGIFDKSNNSSRGLCKSQNHLNYLFYISKKFNELFPIGSEVNLDIQNILSSNKKQQPDRLIVKSESYVLSNYSVVGFICDKSDDDTHMFYVQDLIEYQLILKEIKNEVR